MARPTDYSEELAAAICARVAGGASIVAACRAPGMPDRSTVYRWAAARAEFRDSLARACEERGEALVDQAVRAAVKALKRAETGQASKAEVAAARLYADTLFRRAAQLSPRKLGPLIRVAGDEDAPIPLVIRKSKAAADGD
jgi:hypothetical protein